MTPLEERVEELLSALDPVVTRIGWLVLLLAAIVFAGGTAIHVIA